MSTERPASPNDQLIALLAQMNVQDIADLADALTEVTTGDIMRLATAAVRVQKAAS